MKKIKAVVYTRVSTNKEEQKKSLKMQKEIYKDYCQQKGYELIRIYKDEGSGTNARRKEFQEMMFDAGLDYIRDDDNVDSFVTSKREPKFDLIIVKDTTRFSRNSEIAESVVKRLTSKGVVIFFENVGLKSSNDNFKLIGSFLFKMGENESASMSKKISQTKYYNAVNKKYKPSRLPYGYTWDKERNIVIVPEQAEVVKRIYSSYAEKGSMILTKELNNEGIKTQRGHMWSSDKIVRIVKNLIYTGTAVVNRTYKEDVTDTKRLHRDESEFIYIPDAVPPIITLEQHEEANKIRESRINVSNKNKRGRKVSYNDIYFQKIKCGSCGKGFKKHTTAGTGRKKKINYMCMSRVKGNNCNTRGVALNNLNRGLNGITLNSHVETMKEQVEFKQLIDRIGIELVRLEESKNQLQNQIDQLSEKCSGYLSTISSYIEKGESDLAEGFEAMYKEAVAAKKALESQFEDMNIERIRKLENKVKKKKELIQELKHSQYFTNEDKLKLLKNVVVTDYELEYFFTMPNYIDEIQEFNSIFQDNPIEVGLKESPNGITVRRNHKEAREYFSQLAENYEEMERLMAEGIL